MDIEKQLKVLKRGVEEIIPEKAFEEKLIKAQKTGNPLRIKCGIDPTKPDVHIGHLVPYRKMRQFQDLGHVGIVIIGDYTASIGDPTGRLEERPHLTPENARKNAEKYLEQLFKVLDPKKTEIHYNGEWFSKFSFEQVLNLAGKVTFAQIMAHETFRKRYEGGEPLSMHELMYPLLQGYDSVAIKADIELGATEQKFNILMGRELQRVWGQEPQVALLFPILIGIDGVNKMSKSLNNYIGVTDKPDDVFGRVMSIPDSLIKSYWEVGTSVDQKKLDEVLVSLASKDINPRDIKLDLAQAVVSELNSSEEGVKAKENFIRTFSERKAPAEDLIKEVHFCDGEYWIVKFIVEAGCAKSNGEARRLISHGAFSIDDNKITDVDKKINVPTDTDGKLIKIGKKNFIRVASKKRL
ncbi:MAG: tyrosine--tRNA ligase [Candidatus Aureabacteria bacterium]|nr:tyrosine--tRNA ligase [Candidatus Auribacterota bacterium]